MESLLYITDHGTVRVIINVIDSEAKASDADNLCQLDAHYQIANQLPALALAA